MTNMDYCLFKNISGKPIQCSESCTCHYNQTLDENVLIYSGHNVRVMPTSIPNDTDKMVLFQTNITHLCEPFPYIDQITSLEIVSSRLTSICDDTLDNILSSKTLKHLDISNNNVRRFSTLWLEKASRLEKLWLVGNPVECECDMIWMANWLVNKTTTSGSRLVQDYKNLVCSSPKTKNGTPVYKLDKVKLGCYPKDKPLWIIEVSSTIGAVILVVVAIVLPIHRQWRIVRWLVYKNFDKLVGDPDRHEDILNAQFDAFISFRYVMYMTRFRKENKASSV